MSEPTEGFWDAMQTMAVRQYGTDEEWKRYSAAFPERVTPPCREPDDLDPPCPSCGVPVVSATLNCPEPGRISYQPCGHKHPPAGYSFGFGFVAGVCRIRLKPDHSAVGGEGEARQQNAVNDPVRAVGGKPEGRQ